MKCRNLVGAVLALICLAALWGVGAQRRRLTDLRSEQAGLLSRLEKLSGPTVAAEPYSESKAGLEPPTTSELLRLRNEVTRLTEQRQTLANVRAENARLRDELAARATNSMSRMPLPKGYVRKAEAQMVGFDSPENTIQSLLWAMQNHDFATFLQAFTPEAAEKLMKDLPPGANAAPEEVVFREAERILGLGVVAQRRTGDGLIEAEVQMVPTSAGRPEATATIRFQQTNGQWKIMGPF